jgi:hypothetical protein
MKPPLQLVAVVAYAAMAAVADDAVDEDKVTCTRQAAEVLARNAPAVELAPDAAAAAPNAYVSSRVHFVVDWSHLHELIDGNCVVSYMVEYGRGHETAQAEAAANEQRERAKRESSSNDASVTRPLSPADGGPLHTVISVVNDCGVYYAQLVAIIGRGHQTNMVRSQTRLFWPAAFAAVVDAFSDTLILHWPDACAHATRGWSLTACLPDGMSCQEVELAGGSPLPLSGLKPCSVYELELLSGSGRPLWAKSSASTLPKADFAITAGHRRLRVRIAQEDCHPAALVHHWTVTRCAHGGSQLRRSNEASVAKRSADSASPEASGDYEEYYYYVEEATTEEESTATVPSTTAGHRSGEDCVSVRRTSDQATLEVDLVGLSSCTLYAVDVTATDARGRSLQPAEQYVTIHSTLCGGGGDNADDHTGADGSPFWFDEPASDNRGKYAQDDVGGFLPSILPHPPPNPAISLP